MRPTWSLLVCTLLACSPASTLPPRVVPTDAAPLSSVPVGVAAVHFHTIEVDVSGETTQAILDTGIGLALISQALCDRLACESDGEFSGQRMSGQTVTLPLTTLDSLSVGGVVQYDVPAGIVDIEGFFPEPQIEAFVGLPFFENQPFTLDPNSASLIVESEGSLAARQDAGESLDVRLERHGVALDIFVPVTLGDGVPAEMLMDTGSAGITLDLRYAEALGVDLEGEGVESRVGQDETAHRYTRYFTTLDAPLAFSPRHRRSGLRAMFQDIIHDGLIGVELMSQFVITYDLPNARVIVAPRVDARPL
ncbi:MAG: pepsin/retropepsin-like aspartic protease family protein [Sandaracinaceae bacterium]